MLVSMAVGTAPVLDESFVSWVDRSAANLGLTTGEALRGFGFLVDGTWTAEWRQGTGANRMSSMTDTTPLSIHSPTGDPRGGIVVVQEAFGVNGHIEDVAQRFADAGWLAVAPHLFHRSGDPQLGYDDFSQVMPHMSQLTADGVLADMDAAIASLAEAGIESKRTGVVGFCMGGNVAVVTAARRDIGAAVTFYGGGIAQGRFGFGPLLDEAAGLRAPWLGLFGDLDQGIPVDQVEQLRIVAASSGQPTEVVRYPDAGHGFHCDQRPSYHQSSAVDAWQRTLDWFDRYLTA
jgi:carboxymethylenebutenolidase